MSESTIPVTVSLHELQHPDSLLPRLHEAFGANGLGIILVNGLPHRFHQLRTELLINATRLAQLPDSSLQKLENKESRYLVGWSRGRETFDGKTDTQKGSFYFNPTYDPQDISDHPEYESPNVWPNLPGFKYSAEELGRLIVSIGLLVARACDVYMLSTSRSYQPALLETILRDSRTCKARLLHYFPGTDQDWCGEHLDHGCLTGLTSALYHEEPGSSQEIDNPDPEAGLYIRSRAKTTIKVNIPRDCLAFQTGSALELATLGELKAVPHFVKGAATQNIARNTLAVFMQPNLQTLIGNIKFKDFARVVLDTNTR